MEVWAWQVTGAGSTVDLCIKDAQVEMEVRFDGEASVTILLDPDSAYSLSADLRAAAKAAEKSAQ